MGLPKHEYEGACAAATTATIVVATIGHSSLFASLQGCSEREQDGSLSGA